MAGGGALCRDCDWMTEAGAAPRRCPSCRSPRLVSHPELFSLSIGHVDCDAFYASVEKRDNPELRDKPVIVGGDQRGVVTTACYLARISGVRSAMPMFKARQLCPNAVIIKPNMAKYVEASRLIKQRFLELTPLVQPLSLDEAFLDLTGTERLHHRPPALSLTRLARVVEAETGVSISIGLAPNKFLAKIASEIDKPRGFAAVGAKEAKAFLEDKPISIIWGVGAATNERLNRDGFDTVGDIARADPIALFRRYGALGRRLAQLAQGEDLRPVNPSEKMKSVSAETTFNDDLRDPELLDAHLWRLAEKVADRLKAKSLAGRTVTLKLKTARFRVITRRRSLSAPLQLADSLYRNASPLLKTAIEDPSQSGQSFRLLGVGVSDLSAASDPALLDPGADLFDSAAPHRAKAERAVDSLRERFGRHVIGKGRSLK